ncbi:class I tRNA ligase family protein [Candidatus Saccharibacteria bacterium]|nr:class I tRNA ligase family protein [Candidatus Saccharibacteria bacterium]MCL1962689.1 class I tRNA ligase family protein [Candidatus Saccharibacteria bacterium]
MKRYNPSEIEPKWQKIWEEGESFAAQDNSTKPKKYVAGQFPYPSGAGLHAGHTRVYSIVDATARFYRQNGYEVLNPMGWDTFGMPAENYAIKTGISPQAATKTNIANFKHQFKRLGVSIDWDREINTSHPEYYKWTQWIFAQLYKKGLAYRAENYQWWCPIDKTVLANEQVENGKCWRCGSEVEKKKMRQWFFRITKYAEELLAGLDDLDWPEGVKAAQRNWIGKSTGAEIDFEVEDYPHFIDKRNPLRSDKPFTKRKIIQAFVHDPKTNKYLFVKWKKFPWTSCVIGGIEGDEDAVAVARREILEETGYKNLKFERVLGKLRSEFYAANKEVNRDTDATQVLFTLENDERAKVSAEEDAIQEPVWLDRSECQYDDMPNYDETMLAFERIDGKRPTHKITTFTTRPDTMFGITFLVLAPEHPMVGKITTEEYAREVEKYRAATLKKSDIERQENKEKTGVFTGAYVINPANGERVPVWAGDFVIAGYGTGAILATPAHDERDWEFAVKFNLPIKVVLNPTSIDSKDLSQEIQKMTNGDEFNHAFHDEGVMVNSGEFSGLSSPEMREKVVKWLAQRGAARFKTTYKMRDWLISRQRYWGAPIPIAYDKDGNEHLIPDDQLPVILPKIDDYKPDDSGRSALAKSPEFTKVIIDGIEMTRETDTMDGFACSSWYLLRYADPRNGQHAWDPKKVNFWNPVDYYVGGEHSTTHMLYVRMWTMFFRELGLTDFSEPITKFMKNGQILAADGTKMSKSKGNTIDPLEVIDSGYGADALRTYILFMVPPDMDAAWSLQGLGGVHRFLGRVWNLVQEYVELSDASRFGPPTSCSVSEAGRNGEKERDNDGLNRIIHKTIKKVTNDMRRSSFNTAIAALMECTNELYKLKENGFNDEWRKALSDMMLLLAPFAPHMAAELFEQLGNKEMVEQATYPTWDEKYLVSDVMTIAVQVNGKLRATITVPVDADRAEIEKTALAHENAAKFIGGKKPKKIIYVPGKIVNVVI